MDFADEAAAANDCHLNDALARHKLRVAARAGEDSAEYCAACGEIIPEARRRAVPGCQLCVDCQAEEENYCA